jgi:hemolysin activation/secretion protein
MDLLLRDLTGFGEIVSFSPSLAEGFVEIGGQFQVPVSVHDTRLFGRMLYTRSRIVEEPFDALDIESETYEFGIGVSQPLYRAPGKTLTASLGHDYRVNKTFLLDNPFSFSEGAEDGRTAVSALRGTLEWVDRSQEQVIALRSVVSLGTGLFDATTHSGERADSEFLSVLGQAQWVRRLGDSDARVVARGQAQWTGDRLLPMEKFSVGGVASVRGYREDLQTGDRGWNASLEFQIPIAELPPLFEGAGGGGLTVIPFIDAGRAWNVNDNSNETLLSVGAGLAWEVTSDVHAKLFVGRGLMNRPDPADGDIQDIGIHFSLSAKLY